MTKKLALGTVQMGLNYGINNTRGKPSRGEALKILDTAFENGVQIFDTAAAYGDAEEILGEWMTMRGVSDRISIISKLRPHAVADVDATNTAQIVEEEVGRSLARLRRDYLDGYLLHTPEYIYHESILAALEMEKRRGRIRNIGLSAYEEADALFAARSGRVDYIQIPYSVFDQRMDRSGFFAEAKKTGVVVFARSAFLQGLICMEAHQIPDHLAEARDYLRTFDAVIGKYGLNRIQAALLFSYSHPDINYVVFGVDSAAQLEEDIRIIQKPAECAAYIEELRTAFLRIPKSIIFPSLWKNHSRK